MVGAERGQLSVCVCVCLCECVCVYVCLCNRFKAKGRTMESRMHVIWLESVEVLKKIYFSTSHI